MLLLGGLLLLGMLLQWLEVVDWRQLLEVFRHYAHNWWFPPLAILLMSGLYALAMPGSLFIWISGALFTPLSAAVIITLGGMGGALSAYYFSRYFSAGVRSRITNSPFFAILQRHGDFITLSAVRLFPGFPHSVINYGAGILRLPLPAFLAATLIGFSVKGYLYATAIYQVTRVDEAEDVVSWQLLAPLLLLVALFVAAKLFVNWRLKRRRELARTTPGPGCSSPADCRASSDERDR